MPPSVDTSRQSPNCSEREGYRVELLLIHATVGDITSSLNWLCNPTSKVSSHYVISKVGRIYQLVPGELCAWHAGRAIWHGQTRVNEISIGIELENLTGKRGFEGQDPYPLVQIDALTLLVRWLLDKYSLTSTAVARHYDVAVPKGRKTDPFGFPWDAWRDALDFRRYRFRVAQVALSSNDLRAARMAPTPQAPHIYNPGDVITVDDITAGVAHDASGLGFVPLAVLEAL